MDPLALQLKKLSLRNIRHVALDIDGTIYRGDTLFDTTEPFVTLLGELGIGYTLVTNNPSKNLTDYVEHLAALGLAIDGQQIYSSTQATLEYLRTEWPKVRRLFV